MEETPVPELNPYLPTKLDDEPAAQSFSYRRTILLFFFVILIVILLIPVLVVHAFFASLPPKQKDIDQATKAIQQSNATMDDFEQSLQQIRERIDKLESDLPIVLVVP